MRNTSILHILILVGTIILMGPGDLVWAEAPAIHIDLSFDNSFYEYGEPIGVEVTVTNESGEDLLISQGFSSMVYYMQMRVIDPANNLLLATRDEFHDEFPDAPPVPVLFYQGRFIRGAPCTVLEAGWQKISQTDNIRDFYEMKLPGYYSAQVQLSAMVFKGEPGDPCDINDYEWLGVLKSETRYFYVEGTTQVQFTPNKWSLKWKDDKKIKKTEVHIMPEEGKTTNDYQLDGIKLNNVNALEVRIEPPLIKAFFDRKKSVESLGDVEVGQCYPARITGKLTSGKYFGGSRQIKITR